MLSVPDIAIIGAVALLVFGPEQLPRVARKFGSVMRDVQLTSQQFIREMERAADEGEAPAERHLEAVPSYGDAYPLAPPEPDLQEELPLYGEPAAAAAPPAKAPSEPSEF